MALKLFCEVGNHEMGNLEEHRIVGDKYSCIRCSTKSSSNPCIDLPLDKNRVRNLDSIATSFGFLNFTSKNPPWDKFYVSSNRKYVISVTNTTWGFREGNESTYRDTIEIDDLNNHGLGVLEDTLRAYRDKNLL